jgi:hypothetical protein
MALENSHPDITAESGAEAPGFSPVIPPVESRAPSPARFPDGRDIPKSLSVVTLDESKMSPTASEFAEDVSKSVSVVALTDEGMDPTESELAATPAPAPPPPTKLEPDVSFDANIKRPITLKGNGLGATVWPDRLQGMELLYEGLQMRNVRLWIDYIDDKTVPPPQAPSCADANMANMRTFWQGFKGKPAEDAQKASKQAAGYNADVLIVVKRPPPNWRTKTGDDAYTMNNGCEMAMGFFWGAAIARFKELGMVFSTVELFNEPKCAPPLTLHRNQKIHDDDVTCISFALHCADMLVCILCASRHTCAYQPQPHAVPALSAVLVKETFEMSADVAMRKWFCWKYDNNWKYVLEFTA